MKTFLIRTGFAAAAMLTAPFAALAADMARPMPYVEPAPAYANWTGFYIGINGGYGFGSSDWEFPAASFDPSGGLIGATVGYNFQTGTWVWGVEGDYDYSAIKGTNDCALGVSCETRNSWLGTARARLGYAGWANWLPYITGGVALGTIKASSVFGDATKSKVGWTAGAGIEYALMPNWSVKLEYLYVDLGGFDCGVACGAITDNVSFNTQIVRAGFNYRF